MKGIKNRNKPGCKKLLRVERYCLDISEEKAKNEEEDLVELFANFHDHYSVVEVSPAKSRQKEKFSQNGSSKNSSRGSTKNNTSRTVKTK